jgi:hypothetical protein
VVQRNILSSPSCAPGARDVRFEPMTETILLSVFAAQFAAASMLPILVWQQWWLNALRGPQPDDSDRSMMEQPAPGTAGAPTASRQDARSPARPKRNNRATRKPAAAGSSSPARAARTRARA